MGSRSRTRAWVVIQGACKSQHHPKVHVCRICHSARVCRELPLRTGSSGYVCVCVRALSQSLCLLTRFHARQCSPALSPHSSLQCSSALSPHTSSQCSSTLSPHTSLQCSSTLSPHTFMHRSCSGCHGKLSLYPMRTSTCICTAVPLQERARAPHVHSYKCMLAQLGSTHTLSVRAPTARMACAGACAC